MRSPDTTPVIVGIGEYMERPETPAAALEPVALMAKALQAAGNDSSPALLGQIESVDVVGLVSWRYADPAALLCSQLGITPARQINASMGGETPMRLIHEAALAIARGELKVAAIVGGEAMHARKQARKARVELPWTPQATRENTVRVPGSSLDAGALAKQLGITDPVQMYPLYEMATQTRWGQTPAQAQQISADLWAQFAQAAAANPSAWMRAAPDATTIATVNDNNRLICWPYPKLMVANPTVNQSAAIIVTSLAAARAAGVAEEKLVYLWGGAAAAEPADFLQRDRFDHSTAQSAVLAGATAIAGGDSTRFNKIELYSCFPVVPKLAYRELGLDPTQIPPTVTGGLTFFGGPLNNYMAHATCAMVRALRAAPGELGLLYGQGGILSKHHALVVSTQPPAEPLAPTYSVQARADAAREPVPAVLEHYTGPASIETYTVLYGSDGEPLYGVVVLRTPDGSRTMARISPDDEESLALLLVTDRSAIGTSGHVRIDTFGKPAWSLLAPEQRRARGYRHAIVERDGHLTIVTMNRPESMNALTPAANAELAEIFDDFAADPDQWVAIITGAGDRAFSSGNDLKFTATAMARGDSIAPPLTGFAGLTARFDLNKPVIAAVNGVAMGGGFEIALACDLIIASESAVFALPEPRVGLAAVAGGLLRLPQQIGYKQAMGIILTGRRVTAAEGQTLGFVNEVCAPGELLATARRWAEEIMVCSPMSIRASKEIVQRGMGEETLAAAYQAQQRYPATKALFRSADLREGPLAFAQKRPPRWKSE